MSKSKKVAVSYHTLKFMADLAAVLRPKPPMTVTEWAETHMVLPAGSNEPGRYSSKNMPFQADIMNAITDPYVKDVSVMSSAQVGKTTMILCGIGYYIDYEPATQMLVLPTLTLSEKFSKTRLATMIQDVPVLASKIAPAKSKDSDNTILFKQYAGGHIVLAGANSAASLSSMPLRVIWMDEVDRFPESAGTEGNPIKLAEKRSTTFWNAKHIKTSTPTIHGRSKIETAYNEGTMEEWCVQCPCCGTWQPFEFRRVVFKNITMSCVDCGEEIEERYWKESPQKWIAAHPERKTHRSFHLNELASPFVAWQDIIAEFKKAKEKLDTLHDVEDLKAFVNTTLGEVWDEVQTGTDDDQVDEETLERRAEYYDADIPDGVLMLTAAVDVQNDRFEVEIRGWAREYETWGIYKTEIYGNLEQSEVWEELEEYIDQTLHFADGRALGVAATAIDTGGSHTNSVYRWVRKMQKKGKSVYGIKGYAGKPGIPLLYKSNDVDVKEELSNGKTVVVDHMRLHSLGVDAGKEDIQNRLKIDEPGEGFCHFPSNAGRGYTSTYYKGLFSEKKVIKKVRGVIKEVWVKKSGIRNEPLDLFNYNYATCQIRRPTWNVLEDKLEKGIDYTQKRKRRGTARKNQKGVEW